MTMQLDPVTRYLHVSYQVPADAPDEVVVLCEWASAGSAKWRPARVTPLLSETAMRMLPEGVWAQWRGEGRIVERRAAGLTRTVIFDPYPDAQAAGIVDVDFRVRLQTPEGRELAVSESRLQADNSDVVYIDDWSQVLQRDQLAPDPKPEDRKWAWRTDCDGEQEPTGGNALYGTSPPDVPLRQLTYPLGLTGSYAVFVCTPARYGIDLRLTGDERCDGLSSRWPGQEVLWRWCRMDRQHLVLVQPHAYTGYCSAASTT